MRALLLVLLLGAPVAAVLPEAVLVGTGGMRHEFDGYYHGDTDAVAVVRGAGESWDVDVDYGEATTGANVHLGGFHEVRDARGHPSTGLVWEGAAGFPFGGADRLEFEMGPVGPATPYVFTLHVEDGDVAHVATYSGTLDFT